MNSQNLPLPLRGINKGVAVCVTPSEYASLMNNIWPRDVLETRLRLGQRPGSAKWGGEDQIGGAEQPVVSMCVVSTVTS